MKKKNNKFDIVTMLLLIAIIAVSAAIVFIVFPYVKSRLAYSSIQSKYIGEAGVSEEALKTAGADEGAGSEDTRFHLNIDFASLKAMNPNCDSWIYACGGKISYPVVKASDDSFYLRHGLDGGSLYSGTIFIRSDIVRPYEQFDTAIYGHNMRDGSMFHELLSYKEESYFEDNQYVYILTPEKDMVYQIFAVDVLDESEIPVIETETEESKAELLKKAMGRSIYDCKVEVGTSDRIIELITCEYSGKNNRIVVYAKRISE